jgi:hypothetical protein
MYVWVVNSVECQNVSLNTSPTWRTFLMFSCHWRVMLVVFLLYMSKYFSSGCVPVVIHVWVFDSPVNCKDIAAAHFPSYVPFSSSHALDHVWRMSCSSCRSLCCESSEQSSSSLSPVYLHYCHPSSKFLPLVRSQWSLCSSSVIVSHCRAIFCVPQLLVLCASFFPPLYLYRTIGQKIRTSSCAPYLKCSLSCLSVGLSTPLLPVLTTYAFFF